MRRTQGPSDIVRFSHLGIQFAVVVLAGILAGAQLDKKLSTSLFTLVGTFTGAGIGFYLLYRETRSVDAAPDASDSARPDGDHGDVHPPGRGPGGRAGGE
jgi:F0F1-type ATP synthase assembly protein I